MVRVIPTACLPSATGREDRSCCAASPLHRAQRIATMLASRFRATSVFHWKENAMKGFRGALLGGAALTLLAPASARAAAFFIDDTLTTEQIRFTANDFEGGLSLDGQLFQQGLGNPNTADLLEADAAGNPIVHN